MRGGCRAILNIITFRPGLPDYVNKLVKSLTLHKLVYLPFAFLGGGGGGSTALMTA